jgi:hypothetical protein
MKNALPSLDESLTRDLDYICTNLREEFGRRAGHRLLITGGAGFLGYYCRRPWVTPDLFMGLMRLRGVECASPGGYAEAFHGRKLTL